MPTYQDRVSTLKNDIKKELESRKSLDRINKQILEQIKKAETAQTAAQKENEKLDKLIEQRNAITSGTSEAISSPSSEQEDDK